MKLGFYLILVLIYTSCNTKSDHTNKVEQEQKRRNAVFVNPEQSPLDTAEIRAFKGLHFFAANEQFKVNALITWLPQVNYITIPQSNGSIEDYMQTAVIDFTLNNQQFQLPVYQNNEMKSKHILFIPFTDLTTGKETYNGGRYIDLPYIDTRREVILDFNFAYIPYCAHSPRYACPKVPKENNIPLAITAGERL